VGKYADLTFLRAAEVPRRAGDAVCRESRATRVIVASLVTLVTAALLLAPTVAPRLLRDYDISSGATYYIGGLGVIFVLITVVAARASLMPSNWILRVAGDGLYVKYRSFQNHAFPADTPSVLFIPKREIAWIRGHRHRMLQPSRDDHGEDAVGRSYLEIKLHGDDTGDIADHLRTERQLWGAGIGGKGKFRHYPVRLMTDAIVRIDWSGPDTSISPKIDKAAAILGRNYTIENEAQSEHQSFAMASRDEQESRLLEFAERGDIMSAVILARQLYGYDLTEARAFVEGLIGN
jgi:hypothetical protein